jgi:hypothetical protein
MTSANPVWTQSSTIALAKQKCASCWGLGMTFGYGQRPKPCKCVLRQIFRVCHRKFKGCQACPPYFGGGIRLLPLAGRNRGSTRDSAACGGATRRCFGYPKSEYVADFLAIAKRTLDPASVGYGVFMLHFVAGYDWKICCRRLEMDRGAFFHEVYRVEEKLGRAFREVQPFALFPIDEYFGRTSREAPTFRA